MHLVNLGEVIHMKHLLTENLGEVTHMTIETMIVITENMWYENRKIVGLFFGKER